MISEKEMAVRTLGTGALNLFMVKFCRHQGRVMSYV